MPPTTPKQLVLLSSELFLLLHYCKDMKFFVTKQIFEEENRKKEVDLQKELFLLILITE